MKASVSDIHGSHGSVFTLGLEANTQKDKEVMNFLNNQFKGTSYFYIYRAVSIGRRILQLSFSESNATMATVDHLMNINRKDQKFPVIVLEDKIEQTADGHYDVHNPSTCYWCKEKVWGVQRESIEVLIHNGENFDRQRVDVHTNCQRIREKQMALIPFPSFVMEGTTP